MSGLDIIRAIQTLQSPGLNSFFHVITNLHETTTYILLFVPVIWFWDKKFGRYLISVLVLGIWSNAALKYGFNTSRPSPEDVTVLYPETGTGPAFPSGHSQNPLMIWGAVALRVHKRWFTVFAAVLVFLIGFSRLYAGLHWPLDVIGGWAIGAAMLAFFEVTRSFWTGERMGLPLKLLFATAIPLATLLLAWWSPQWNVPAEMADESWIMTGAYLGFWAGSILEEEFVGFNPRLGSIVTHVIKLVLGLAMVMGVRYGLKAVFPEVALFDAIRYFFVAITASLLAPLVFARFLAAPPAGRSVAG